VKLKILFLILFLFLVSCGKTGNEDNDTDELMSDSDVTHVTDEATDETVDESSDLEENDSTTDESEPDEEADDFEESTYFGELTENPSGNVPLSASIKLLTTDGITDVEVLITDIDDGKEPFLRKYSVLDLETPVDIPVLGLFPDHENVVTLRTVGDIEVEKEYKITTQALPIDFPKIDFEGKIESGWTIGNWIRYPDGGRLDAPFAYDEFARIRWYTDLPWTGCSPVTVRENYFYCSNKADGFRKYDFMGYEKAVWSLEDKGFTVVHHDIFVKDDGDLVVLPNKDDASATMDYVLEMDHETGDINKVWDLKKFFPDLQDLYADKALTNYDNPNRAADPIHVNAVWYDKTDDTIVACGQGGGIMKISRDDKIVWYLIPHIAAKIDDSNGDGVSDSLLDGFNKDDPLTKVGDFKTAAYSDDRMPILPNEITYTFDFNYGEFLLDPLDDEGNPVTDTDVINGFTDSDDFAWPFRTHNPSILESGNILIYDNGLTRNFSIPTVSLDSYSRAVEYEIVEDTDGYGGTIKQVWEYKLDTETPNVYNFSPIVSATSALVNGNRLVVAGSIGNAAVRGLFEDGYEGPRGSLLVEIDPTDNRVVNRVFLNRQNDDFPEKVGLSVYRAQRFELVFEIEE